MMQRGLVGLLFAAVALLLFAPALGGDRLFFPLHTRQLQPWRADQPANSLVEHDARHNAELTDKNFLFQPDTQRMVDEWRAGRRPDWNPSILGGVSQIGQALFGAYYPPHLLYLPFEDVEEAYAWLAALHVFLAALGAHLLLRHWGFSRPIAAFGALAFAVGGPMAVRYHYPMTFYAAVWIPWLWWAVERYAARRTLGRWLWIPPPLALVVLCGFPQTGLYGVYLCAAWGAARLVLDLGRRSLVPLLGLGSAFVVGGVLTAVQILPVLEVQERSLARDRSAEQQIETAGSPWLPSGYVVPDAFHDPRSPLTTSWVTNPLWSAVYARVSERQGRMEPRQQPTPNTTEDACYAGVLGLLLGLAGALGLRRRSLALAALLALAWSYALGFEPLVRATFRFVPGADMGDVRRVMPTIGLLSALLAAHGARAFLDPARRRLRIAVLTAGGVAVLGLALGRLLLQRAGADGLWDSLGARIGERTSFSLSGVFEQLRLDREASASAVFEMLQSRLDWALIAAVAGLAALCLAAFVSRRRPALGASLLGLALLVDLGAYHFRTNPFVPAEGFLEPHPLIDAVAADAEDTRLHRFSATPLADLDVKRQAVLPNNLAMNYGLDDAAGYIVAVPTRWARYLRALQPEPDHVQTVLVTPLGLDPSGRPAALDSPLLDAASIRHVLTQDDVIASLQAHGMPTERWELLAQHGPNRVYRNRRALPFVSVFGAASTYASIEGDEDSAHLHSQILDQLRRGEPRQLHLEEDAEGHAAQELSSIPAADSRSRVKTWRRLPGEVQVELEAGSGGILYLTQGYDPGWRAWVDGEATPVHPANVAFQAVVLPENAREVELRYQPASRERGSALSAAALVLLIVLALAALGLSRHRFAPA